MLGYLEGSVSNVCMLFDNCLTKEGRLLGRTWPTTQRLEGTNGRAEDTWKTAGVLMQNLWTDAANA